MAIFKCKMCGGTLDVEDGATICECEYCGSKQTVPTAKDENLQTLFNRANVLRLKSEFDKAADVYEKILQNSDTEAEAYWGLILCKYGIEYVEDPKTFKRVPTCHRASYDAVTADEDYKNAIKYADAVQRRIYESEAEAIDSIQKGILALAQKEDPYDVFICYKEADDNGKRTQDSVIANDIYHQLTMEGFKVFYAAITLEDKLGSEYEPYIFSALNSSKVMLVLGTKPEYFNAVWVKNEWSRFLKLMKKDRSRLLIPCFRDMDAYELPEEFAHLQAQDMSKIGFISDLVRGIKKVVVKNTEKPAVQKEVVIQQAAGSTTAGAQIQRGNMALEDHEWAKADSFFEEALNLDPQCAEAYIGKLLARDRKPGLASWVAMQKEKYTEAASESLEACQPDNAHAEKMAEKYKLENYLDADAISSLYTYDRSYSSSLSCRKMQKERQSEELNADRLLARAKQYAGGETKKQLENAIADITAALDKRIADAQQQDTESIAKVKNAYAAFISAADKKAEKLNEEAWDNKDKDYRTAKDTMQRAGTVNEYEGAIAKLQALGGYKDCSELIADCRRQIDRINEEKREKAAAAAKKAKKIAAIAAAAAAVCIAAVLIVTKVIIPGSNYNATVKLMNNGDYEEAITAFTALDGYKDSTDRISECRYLAAKVLLDNGQYDEACSQLLKIKGYKDVDTLLSTDDNLIAAAAAARDVAYQPGKYVTFGSYEQDNNTSNGKEDIEWLVLARDGDKALVISRYALDCRQYKSSNTSVTWETCTLRSWLNDTFINEAFTAEEQAMIPTVTVTADKNPNYSTSAGNDTQDKIFLLSITEAEKYFSSNSDRVCKPTAYAKAQGAYTYIGSCLWWLRSPGFDSTSAARVYFGGSVSYRGDSVYYSNSCVRPALWIDIQS